MQFLVRSGSAGRLRSEAYCKIKDKLVTGRRNLRGVSQLRARKRQNKPGERPEVGEAARGEHDVADEVCEVPGQAVGGLLPPLPLVPEPPDELLGTLQLVGRLERLALELGFLLLGRGERGLELRDVGKDLAHVVCCVVCCVASQETEGRRIP